MKHTGEVIWPRVGIFKQVAKFNSHMFPLDEMLLQIELGSWSYKYDQLETAIWKTDTSTGISLDKNNDRNIQWKTLWIEFERKVSEWESGSYSSILINIGFARSSFQGILHCLIIPCTMNIILSILGFFITVNSPLRIYYTAENLMNIIFFMLMVSSLAPITNNNNTIELLFFRYLLFAFCICVMSMFS